MLNHVWETLRWPDGRVAPLHTVVETAEGKRLICHPRGKKSQAVVGDRVLWQGSHDEGTIEKVEERVIGRMHAELAAQSRTMIFAMMSLQVGHFAGFKEFGRRREADVMGGVAYNEIYMDCIASEFDSPVLGRIFVPDVLR